MGCGLVSPEASADHLRFSRPWPVITRLATGNLLLVTQTWAVRAWRCLP
jgi:hypothetical protein